MHSILNLIYSWLMVNLDVVFFVYGLAFVVMGICILILPKRDSKFRLADILWLLAAFGLIHGANEFLDMRAIIKGEAPGLNIIRSFVLVISYIFLFEFGRRLLRLCKQDYIKNAAEFFSWRLTFIIVFAVSGFALVSVDSCKSAAIWARYLLGFPSAILVSSGLILYYKHRERELAPIKLKKYFYIASFFFIVYGILGGLVVPKADFFPASRINTDSFITAVHIPVQVFRAICAIFIAWAVFKILRIFSWETVEKLSNAYKDLEVKIQERTKELVSANDQLIQSEKLNAIGQLASGVAHEVRNPLGIMLQAVNYLESAISVKEKNVSETLLMLKNSVERADKIIGALLDFSRATSLVLQPEDINSILESSLNLVKTKFKFEKIDITAQFQDNIPKVSADKNKLEQVFINVLLNAIQSLSKEGKITIRSSYKPLKEIKNCVGDKNKNGFQIGEEAVVVEVEDTGTGISEQNLKRIFDPFFTTKGPRGGSGLGLSVSRNIIAMHRGLICAESRLGRGTKITVILKAI